MNGCLRFVFLVLRVLLAVFILGACSTGEILPTDKPTPVQIRQIEIDENDKICVSAEDCVLAWTDCSTCECGTPLNQQHALKYERAYEQTCANYRGPVCEISCPEVKLDCIDNLCVTVESGE
jgi:hypothetical protein